MEDIEQFIQKYGGLTEEYKFYDGAITLRYDPIDHVYLLVLPDGSLEPQYGVTNICHIIDKSLVLIPWACKMMAQKLQLTLLPYTTESGVFLEASKLNELITSAKRAHKEKLDEAGDIGSFAHAWIEEYIKSKLNNDVLKYNELLGNFPSDERAKNACLAALDWMHYHNVRWLSTERKVYSRKYKYAGTMDGLCLVDSCANPLCCPNPFKDRLSVADWKTSNYLYPEYLMQTASYEAAYEEETGQQVIDRWVNKLDKETAKFESWHLEEDCFEDDFNAFLAALNLRIMFDKIEERLIDLKDIYRKGKKKAKQEALMTKCKGADKYKGTRKPKCNKGNPCETCLNKYAEVQASKPVKVKVAKIKKNKLTHDEILKNLQSVLKSA